MNDDYTCEHCGLSVDGDEGAANMKKHDDFICDDCAEKCVDEHEDWCTCDDCIGRQMDDDMARDGL